MVVTFYNQIVCGVESSGMSKLIFRGRWGRVIYGDDRRLRHYSEITGIWRTSLKTWRTADLAKKPLDNGLNESEWQESQGLPRTQA